MKFFTKSEFLDFKVFRALLGTMGPKGTHGTHGPHEAPWGHVGTRDFKLKNLTFGIAGRPADFLKIAPGPILNPWGVENRIPHAKIFRFHPLKQFFDRFLKIEISKKFIFQKSIIFSLSIGILKPGSIKIERGMKKYFRGLIMRFFGLMGGSLVPGEGPS